MIDSSALGPAMQSAPATNNATTCSGSIIGTAPIKIYRGTGAYAGISGTGTITLTIAFISPKLKSGKCNQSDNAKSLSMYSSVTGTGNVTF